MRLLVLLPYVPYPLDRGTFQRVYHLTRELARHHEVDLFCLDTENRAAGAEEMRRFCRHVEVAPFDHGAWPRFFPDRIFEPLPTTVVHWLSESVAARLASFAQRHAYDLVYFCDLVLWPYVRAVLSYLPTVMDRSRVDLLFQQEELAALPLSWKERFLRRENLRKLRRLEQSAALGLAGTVVCGPDDEQFLRTQVRADANITVIPNGVAPELFSPLACPGHADHAPTLLFCGAMDYSPNIDGLRWYFSACDAAVRAAVPDRRILLVGRDPSPEVRALADLPGVTVTGGVPDVRPYYRRAWAQIVPLRIGGGTRLKIVESLALGTPVVSTAIGAQGLDLCDGAQISLADTPDAFARSTIELLRDEALRRNLADAGGRRVFERYTWPRLGRQLSDFLRQNTHSNHHRHAA